MKRLEMKMAMKKMVYICPVDWKWIKQRPQFLAEELSVFYDIHVLYPFNNNRYGLQKGTKVDIPVTPWFSLPTWGGRLKSIPTFNEVFARKQIQFWLWKIQPEILWASMPWQLPFIPKRADLTIIYDCMDDYPAIEFDGQNRGAIIRQEEQLCHRADLIFTSSQMLYRNIQMRYGVSSEKVKLLRNGYSADWDIETGCEKKRGENLKIGYFGTIGRWFNFELLLKSLRKFDQIEYHLFGPAEVGIQIPQHERMIIRGVLEHKEIVVHAREMDALMMPFIPNEVVQSVDPVKLYEYIALNKNIVCIEYPEVQRFAPYVMFYQDEEGFMGQIMRLLKSSELIYTKDEAYAFLKNSSWSVRAVEAYRSIEEIKVTRR